MSLDMEAQQHKELFISARSDSRVEPRSSKTKRVQVEEATPGPAEIKKQRLCKVKDSSGSLEQFPPDLQDQHRFPWETTGQGIFILSMPFLRDVGHPLLKDPIPE